MYIARKLSMELGGSLSCESTAAGVSYLLNVPFAPASATRGHGRTLRILYAEVRVAASPAR